VKPEEEQSCHEGKEGERKRVALHTYPAGVLTWNAEKSAAVTRESSQGKRKIAPGPDI